MKEIVMERKKAGSERYQKHRGGQVSFRVTPELLRQQAERLAQAAGEAGQILQEIDKILKKTEFYWLGRAAQAHRTVFAKKREGADIIVETLREHVRMLCGMAFVYQEAEAASELEAEELPVDILS